MDDFVVVLASERPVYRDFCRIFVEASHRFIGFNIDLASFGKVISKNLISSKLHVLGEKEDNKQED